MRPEFLVGISLGSLLVAAGLLILSVLAWARSRRAAGHGEKADAAEPERRIAELQKLLSEADTNIAALRARLEQAGTADRSGAAPQENPANVEIIRLGRGGLDVVEIAKRVNMPVGEVQLVLNLDRADKTRLRA